MRFTLIFSALLLPFASGCAVFGDKSTNNEQTTAAWIGGVTGALIGEHNDEPLAGAIIGTATGALLGNAVSQENDRIAAAAAVAEAEYMENAVTLNQLLEMTQAGVDDAIIISRIEANGPAQKLSTDDIILLSKSQVAPSVISTYQASPVLKVDNIHTGNPVPIGHHYPFPIVPAPTTGFSIGLDFGN